jgi:hypothetical protein
MFDSFDITSFCLGIIFCVSVIYGNNTNSNKCAIEVKTKFFTNSVHYYLLVPPKVSITNLNLQTSKQPTEIETNEYFTVEKKFITNTIYSEGHHLLLKFNPTHMYKNEPVEWQTQITKTIEGWYFQIELTNADGCIRTELINVNINLMDFL